MQTEREQTFRCGTVKRSLLGQPGRLSLVQFEPSKNQSLPLPHLQFQDQVWQSLYQLAAAINEPEEDKALVQVLQAGHELAQVSIIGFYQLEEVGGEETAAQLGAAAGRQVLKRKAYVGDGSVLSKWLPTSGACKSALAATLDRR